MPANQTKHLPPSHPKIDPIIYSMPEHDANCWNISDCNNTSEVISSAEYCKTQATGLVALRHCLRHSYPVIAPPNLSRLESQTFQQSKRSLYHRPQNIEVDMAGSTPASRSQHIMRRPGTLHIRDASISFGKSSLTSQHSTTLLQRSTTLPHPSNILIF